MKVSELTQAVVDFLLDCPYIEKLFFNFAEAADGNNQFIKDVDTTLKKYIDGGQLRCYTYTIVSYHAVSHNPLVDEIGFADENMENLNNVQNIIDWVNEQNELRNYPSFGQDIVIDSMECLTDDPSLNGVDVSQNPPLAKYSFTIRIQYLDNSKAIK
jgi:hypothetical protein